jgi:tRNA pseudouridine55 synthase
LSSESPHGVLVVDKPAGPTSHDVVDRVRKALRTRRVGHTGTLDPFATGVLPVCVGKATRLAQFLAGGDKVYRAGVRLGFATTTDDLHGEPLGAARAVEASRAEIESACAALTGAIDQLPPAYSAKRVDGRRLYELARKGVEVQRRTARVTVHAISVLSADGEHVELEVRCSPGTYVRALARDLGEKLGCGAHLVELRRLESGGFSLEDAVGWDDLLDHGRERLVPLGHLLPELPAVQVSAEGLRALRHGRDLPRALCVSGFTDDPAPRVRVLDESGSLAALAVPRGFGASAPWLTVEPVLHPDVVLVDNA